MSSFCSPDKITVSPDRFRIVTVEDQDVKEMAESIKEIGQLQPVLVDKDMGLIDGLNRLMACVRLGKDVWFATETDGKLVLNNPMLRRVAEFQANFRRKDFTPAQSAMAIAEIDRLMKEVYGEAKPGKGISEGWSKTDTAKKLGYKSPTTVDHALLIAKAVEHNVPGVAEAKTNQEALSIVKKICRMEAAEEMARRQSADQPETAEIQNPIEFFGSRIILGNCLEKMKELASGVCNLFVTDPPWKIEVDKAVVDYGTTGFRTLGNYDDSSDDILPLIEGIIEEMFRVAKPDCYAVMFCGIEHFTHLINCFRKAGFQTYKKPLVWVKTDQSGQFKSRAPAPSIWPASVTDFMILARKGNPILAQLHRPDAFICPPVSINDKCHQAQKPLRLLEEIISRFYHPGTNPLLIDPFAGSGSTLTAARRVGLKQYFGYELSATNRDRAIANMVNQYMKDISEPDTTTIDIDEFE